MLSVDVWMKMILIWTQADSRMFWEPERPEGEGWFVGSIHDTERWPGLYLAAEGCP
uniref:Uncharacterized protein n=1 Tax=Salmonella sp. TaxID=599 RepID=A0A482EX58_SALSP|nr:hypothetical protein NNIBIDOC_00095 [Salmonella sp.]